MVVLTPLTIRLDKKCGFSGIAENKKCGKGNTAATRAGFSNPKVQTALKVTGAAALGSAALMVETLHHRGLQRRALTTLKMGKSLRIASRSFNTGSRVAPKTRTATRTATNNRVRTLFQDNPAPLSKARLRKQLKKWGKSYQ
jgi:hypothetical protein